MALGIVCVTSVMLVVLLLLLLLTAILYLLALIVQLVTLRYTLMISALACLFWFVHSRRQSYAKGFYSCTQLPQMQLSQHVDEKTALVEKEAVAMQIETGGRSELIHSDMLPTVDKKMATTPPSETESEGDDIETAVEGPSACMSKIVPSHASYSEHSMSSMDVRARSHTTEAELQQEEAIRPRSSTEFGDSSFSRLTAEENDDRTGKYNKDGTEQKRRVPRRRAASGMTNNMKQSERARRATFASKQDVHKDSRRSCSDRVEDALRSDGYWIGDFRVQRRLVSRRSPANNSFNAN